jgi:hypothetical protein
MEPDFICPLRSKGDKSGAHFLVFPMLTTCCGYSACYECIKADISKQVIAHEAEREEHKVDTKLKLKCPMCTAVWPEDSTKILNGHNVQTVIHNVWLNDLLENQLPKDINNLTEAEKEALEKLKAEQDLALHVNALRDRKDLKL